MIIDEQIYLEHHGIRGMHWGVRNKPERTPEQRTKRKHRNRFLAKSAVAFILAGVAYAAADAGKIQHLPISNLTPPSKKPSEFQKTLAERRANGAAHTKKLLDEQGGKSIIYRPPRPRDIGPQGMSK